MEITDSPDRGHRRRLIVFVVGSVVAVLALAGVVYFKDDPLGDHSDLAPKGEWTEAGEAAFRAWVAAAAAIDEDAWPGAGGEYYDYDFNEVLKGAQPWDSALADKVLAAQREALDLAFRADVLGSFRLPAMKSVDQPEFETGPLIHLAKSLQLLTLERARAGDFAAAAAAAVVNLRFGDRFIEGTNSLLSYLVGLSLQGSPFGAIDSLGALEMPDAWLMELIAALGDEPDLIGAFQHSLRAEFDVLDEALDDRVEFYSVARPPPSFLFKRNRTLNDAANSYRGLIAEAAKLPAARSPAPSPPAPSGWERYSPNAYGKYLNSGPNLPMTILNMADHSTAYRRLLRAKLALLRYERATGKLPATLAELVPGYLDAVPADPFDGKPVRYDAAGGRLWVIGTDLKDGGGALEAEAGYDRKASDPTLFLHPGTPEAR